MNITDIKYDKQMLDFVKSITSNPMFPRLKDAFVAHSPAGEKESEKTPDAIPIAHGKWLGTRYVFNTLEDLSITTFQPRNQKPTSRVDRDLED